MLRIILNNTIPKHVTLSRFDFETKVRTNVDFSHRDLHRATEVSQGQQGLEVYHIRVRKPGAYRLESVTTKDQLDVRLQPNDALVFTCPAAEFLPLPRRDYCRKEQQPLTLSVAGVPPLTVKYTRRIGDSISNHQIDNIQPDNYISPFINHDWTKFSSKPVVFSTDDDMDWAATQQISLMLNLTLTTASQYQYQIETVTDGAGNVMEMIDPVPANLDVHSPPSIKFQCDLQRPAKLLIGSKSVELPLYLQGQAPWKVEYEFSNAEAAEATRKTASLDSQVSTISVTQPGDYKILNLEDKFCKGESLRYLPFVH